MLCEKCEIITKFSVRTRAETSQTQPLLTVTTPRSGEGGQVAVATFLLLLVGGGGGGGLGVLISTPALVGAGLAVA